MNSHSHTIDYALTGQSTTTDSWGMRPMQARVFAQRDERFLLIKAPPASGKSRALMFVGLHKLHQGHVRRIIVAVPEKSIGGSFRSTKLTPAFPYDWEVAPYFNLCDAGDDRAKVARFHEFFRQTAAPILLCTHATLRSAAKELPDEAWDGALLAVDEFHHASADALSGLGEVVRRVMNESTGHVVAMTGSYFRGDGVPVLRPEDEARFTPVTYDYYEQLTGYRYLRRLRLGYYFYQGSYLDRLGEVLDTRRKTIIHIPSVNSRTSTGDKYTEVETILNLIGTPDGELRRDPNRGGIHRRRRPDGSLVLVADLVEDSASERSLLQSYLQRDLGRDDLDIIIALGTAKEGFDWPWCEQCLTVGVRGSLTEVIQIIGRCTRDCPGKEEASFINLIAQPDAQQEDVLVSVNDFLKAITASLLMEQVMAPRWDFRTASDPDIDPEKPNAFQITVQGLKEFSSEQARKICNESLTDLTAQVFQDIEVQKSLCGGVSPEQLNQQIIPRIVRQSYPSLDGEDVEAVSQRLRLEVLLKGGTPVDPVTKEPITLEEFEQKSQESEGNRLMKLTNQFINLDELSINLIDRLNPFQRAYEILSKHLDAPTLRAVQASMQAGKIEMSPEEAMALFPRYKERVEAGRTPSLKSPNLEEKRLAEAFEVLKALKLRRMQGLDYTDGEKGGKA